MPKLHVFLGILLAARINALDNGVGVTPPMGWLSWQRFRCQIDCTAYPKDCINEELYHDMANHLVSDGYLDAGYNYVNIDDCWQEKERDQDGKLVGDKQRFPSGMKAMGEYLHGKGLKYGIYSDVGSHTCMGYPGSIDNEELDANTFAEWGVDSLKLDGCYCDNECFELRYPLWAKKMNETGRPMLYECSWPAYIGIGADFDVISESCNYWRNFNDINDNWDDITTIIDWWGDNQDVLRKYAKPGAFNDPDMLIIGNFALSIDESKTQMSIWAIIAAPLYMSHDLRSTSPEAREVLLNKEVIAVNQDPMGKQGMRLKTFHGVEWWVRDLVDGSIAVVISYRANGGSPKKVSTSLESLGINTPVVVRDLWEHKDLGEFKEEFMLTVNPHGVAMVIVTPIRRTSAEDDKHLRDEHPVLLVE